MKKTIFIVLTVVLIFFTLFPRSVELLNKNYLFGFDQGRDYLAVRNIVVDHKLTLIGSEWGAGSAGFIGLFHGPFHYYFLSIPFLILNGDPYGGIILMFLFGLLTVILSYIIGRKLFGNIGGFLPALLIAISPPLISQSRFVWNSHPAPFFILLVFYYIYSLSISQKKRYILLASFFSSFIYNFQTAIAIPMTLALLLYFIIILRLRTLKPYLLSLLGILLGILPFFLFELRHGFMGIKGSLNYFLNGSQGLPQSFITLLQVRWSVFSYNFYDTFPKQTLIPMSVILALCGAILIYFLYKERNNVIKKMIQYLLLLPFVSFVVFLFFKNLVYVHYLIHLNLVYIFIFSYIVYSSYNNKQLLFKLLFTMILGLFLLISIPEAIITSRKDLNDYGGDAKIKGKIDAIDYIYKDAKNQKFGLLIFSPPVYTYPYDYILAWYAEKKYQYIPHKEKKGLFYLLIEVDYGKPWSYNGWIETVIKTGKVVKTEKLPSGFIIQKRIGEI